MAMPWEVGVHSAQMTVGCAKLNLKIKQDSNQNRDHQVSSLNYSPSSDFFCFVIYDPKTMY